jgi:DNA-binding protein HU-beta
MSTITKTQIIKEIADGTTLSQSEAGIVVDKLIGQIDLHTTEGNKVALKGFGIFERRGRAARTGRNPSTGESIQIAASSTLAFKAAKGMKSEV